MYKKLLIFVLFFFVFLSFAPHALAATLYLSPASGTIGTGRTKAVQIRVNADGINGVSAYLSYPADKLQVTSLSYGGSFSVAAEGSFGGGGIRISRGSFNNVTGDVLVATVTFKGLKEGPAAVSFIGGSQTTRTSDSGDSLTGKSGGSYTVAFAAPEPTKVPGIGPLISKLAVSDIATNSATISWETDKAADSIVEYGLEKGQYFIMATDSAKPATTHSVLLNSPALIPGTVIHYQVSSKDADGNQSLSQDGVFQLKGYTLRVKVHSADGTPVANTQVLLYSDPKVATTDASGVAMFENVTAGSHVIIVKLPLFDKTEQVTVADSPAPQDIDITITQVAKPTEQNNMLLYGGILAAVVLVIIIVLFLLRRKKAVPQDVPTQMTPQTPQY
jgi:hypothetical protein